MTVRGLDLSHNNPGPIDFAKVKAAGYTFVHLKATEGTGFTDPTFYSRAVAARQAGLLVGAYHFGHPKNDPDHEAIHFLTVRQGAVLDLPPVLDLEVTDGAGNVTGWANSFLSHLPRDAWVYSSQAFYQAHLATIDRTAWVARLGNKPRTYDVWQHTWTQKVPGVPHPCDASLFPGTFAEFKRLCGITSPLTPAISLKLLTDAIANKRPYWGIATIASSLHSEGYHGFMRNDRWGPGKAATWKKYAGHTAIDRATLERLGIRHHFLVTD